MLSVLIVSPVRIYREGIAEGLSRGGRFATTAATPAAAAGSHRPNVVVYDAGDERGPEGVRALKRIWADARVVVLGIEQRGEVLPWAEAGATGFVGWDASLEAVARVVDGAARGELFCSPAVASALCERLASLARLNDAPSTGGLTSREREIARLLEQGLTNKEIASRLCIQAATVKNHVHRILAKLGARRRGEAAARIRHLHPDLLASNETVRARVGCALG